MRKTPAENNDFFRLNLFEDEPVCLDIGEEGWTAETTYSSVLFPNLYLEPEKLKKSPVTLNKYLSAILSSLKFLTVSAAIFLVAFLALNWSAYRQVFNSWISQGRQFQANVTNQFEVGAIHELPLLEISKDPEIQKKQIPPIDINVAPPDTRIFIPRINKNVPIVPVSSENLMNKDWSALEQDIQEALKNGVIHYPKTAWPGEKGNVFLTGHSSYYPWDDGKFKDVFALLHDVQIGDLIEVYYQQQKHTYRVFDIKVVKPEQVDVLSQPDDYLLTLMTCTPVGTNWKRLIITAREEQ